MGGCLVSADENDPSVVNAFFFNSVCVCERVSDSKWKRKRESAYCDYIIVYFALPTLKI